MIVVLVSLKIASFAGKNAEKNSFEANVSENFDTRNSKEQTYRIKMEEKDSKEMGEKDSMSILKIDSKQILNVRYLSVVYFKRIYFYKYT